MSKNNFQKLYEIDVNHKTKEKSGLKYLSWAWAWAEFKKVNSDATYSVDLYDGKPYLGDDVLGYMVSTTVTVGELTIPMHLPVLDGANKAQKAVSYKYKTKYAEKDCLAASMFDINTAIMRCLTKNLAMFGLGLYIYAGEDIPSVDNSAEIADSIAMIDQAIQTSDNQYVSNHWSTTIANAWVHLGNERIDKLNEMAGL
jgi:hypothetical protein